MTALPSLLFSCFQAFFAALARPIPLSRPPFVTNLLHSRLCPALFHFLSHSHFHAVLFHFLPHSRLCPALFHFLTHSHFRTALFHFCCILASVPPYSRLLFATFSASIILSVYISRAIILSVSPAYTKSIYIITKYYFECRFGSNLYSPSAVKYLFFYLSLGQRQ